MGERTAASAGVWRPAISIDAAARATGAGEDCATQRTLRRRRRMRARRTVPSRARKCACGRVTTSGDVGRLRHGPGSCSRHGDRARPRHVTRPRRTSRRPQRQPRRRWHAVRTGCRWASIGRAHWPGYAVCRCRRMLMSTFLKQSCWMRWTRRGALGQGAQVHGQRAMQCECLAAS